MRRAALLLSLFSLFFLMAGCATTNRTPDGISAQITSWSGRLSVRVDASPSMDSQSFSSSFELQGRPELGQLRFFTPLGNTAAAIIWSPQQAQLQTSNEIRYFNNIAELIEHLLGTPVPLPALFAWLAGDPSSLDGWEVDHSQFGSGKIVAQRISPAPRAEIRVLLEP